MSEGPRHWTGAFLSPKTCRDDFSVFDVGDEQAPSAAVVGRTAYSDFLNGGRHLHLRQVQVWIVDRGLWFAVYGLLTLKNSHRLSVIGLRWLCQQNLAITPQKRGNVVPRSNPCFRSEP